MTIDAWIQHPTPRFLQQKMLAPLRRWMGDEIPSGEVPLGATIAALDAGGVAVGMLSAWHGPVVALISNDQVAAWVTAYPTRLAGIVAVDLRSPVRAVRELRRCV